MKWSLDTHKYISEITRKALQIIVKHGITSQSTQGEIDIVERELANEGIYKNYEGSKGRVRRALFTYFRAYECLDSTEQLTEVGKAFYENRLTIQEFCFHFIVNYKYENQGISYYPIELMLKFLKGMGSSCFEEAYITPYDFSRLVDCNSIDEINDEFISEAIQARDNVPITVEERKIGYDIWAKMAVNAGILIKDSDKNLKVRNVRLAEWILSAYQKNNDTTKGKIVTGIICDLPIFPYRQYLDWENCIQEANALQAFLFDGLDSSIIQRYIKKTSNMRFETLLSNLGVSESSRGVYKDFIGLEKLVAYKLQEQEDSVYKIIGSILLNSDVEAIAIQEEVIGGGANILLYGVPGSGKSWTIEHEYCEPGTHVERLVFHPDYTNADFIGQILPVVDEEKQVTYEFVAGPFTNILREAYQNPQRKFVLIIEEINRGNAPAIFGDVFQLLDRMVEEKTVDGITYNAGTSEYSITNENIANWVYDDATHKVRVPSNLSILGTMNTSDQNVFTLDTAFQRRWQMRLIENNFDNVRTSLANAPILDTGITWKHFCETINKIIIGNKAKMASAEDKRLGVYFVHEGDLKFDEGALPSEGSTTLLVEYNNLLGLERLGKISDVEASRLREIRKAVLHNRLFPEKVIKYLWDDAFKFNSEALFDTDSMDSLEKVIRTFVFSKGQDRCRIFRQSVREALYPNQQQ